MSFNITVGQSTIGGNTFEQTADDLRATWLTKGERELLALIHNFNQTPSEVME